MMIQKRFAPNKCRLCGLNKSQGVDVYCAGGKHEELILKINKNLSKEIVHISIGDGLPKFVCTECETVINNFMEFCDMVQEVQKRLEEEKLRFSEESLDKNEIELNISGSPFKSDKSTGAIPQVNSRNEAQVATVSIGPEGKVECMLCQTYLEAASHTTLHMVTHGIGTVICQCRVCGQQGELAYFLRNSGSVEVGTTVWCSSCEFMQTKKLKSASQIKNTLSGTKRQHICEICSKAFRSPAHLVRHRLIHSGAKPFLCEVCGTGFSQRSTLKLHVISHTGLNPHKCPHCGQTFRFRVSLRSHVLSLHGVPSRKNNYSCDRCGKHFATSYKLRRHYRSHTGERPYECTRCGKLFSQTGNLNNHRKKHEEEDAAGVVDCLSSSADFANTIVPKNHITTHSNVMLTKQTSEQFNIPMLSQTQPHNSHSSANQYIPEADGVLVGPHDPKFLDTILQHPVVPCGDLSDPGNALSSIDSVLLNTANKVPDHSSFVTLGTDFSSPANQITSPQYIASASNNANKDIAHKNSNELYSHFSQDSLLFIDDPHEMQDPSSNSDGITLPTFSSLQPTASVPLSNLNH